MPTVAITDYSFPDLEIEQAILSAAGFEMRSGNDKQTSALKSIVAEADAVITQFAPINAEVIGAMQRAKVIVRYGIGVRQRRCEGGSASEAFRSATSRTTASTKSPITRSHSYWAPHDKWFRTRCMFATENGGWQRRLINCELCAIKPWGSSASVASGVKSQRDSVRSRVAGWCSTPSFLPKSCETPVANRCRWMNCSLSPTS